MDEQEGAGVDLDPQTRESFNLLRQTYDNTAHFVSALLQDRKLQKQLRMIVRTLGPLHQEYVKDLRCHKEGQTSVLYWHGDRASGTWFSGAVLQTLSLLYDSSFVPLLDLLPQPLSLGAVLTDDDAGALEDKSLVKQLFTFIVELSANRCWSQSFWTMCHVLPILRSWHLCFQQR